LSLLTPPLFISLAADFHTAIDAIISPLLPFHAQAFAIFCCERCRKRARRD
jgi:hypothetical protein